MPEAVPSAWRVLEWLRWTDALRSVSYGLTARTSFVELPLRCSDQGEGFEALLRLLRKKLDGERDMLTSRVVCCNCPVLASAKTRSVDPDSLKIQSRGRSVEGATEVSERKRDVIACVAHAAPQRRRLCLRCDPYNSCGLGSGCVERPWRLTDLEAFASRIESVPLG